MNKSQKFGSPQPTLRGTSNSGFFVSIIRPGGDFLWFCSLVARRGEGEREGLGRWPWPMQHQLGREGEGVDVAATWAKSGKSKSEESKSGR